mmetsp:Transcript_970/g.2317  ORF Transcript_970/g.2317 Transcript_970/m.2317 type:complete len:343 (+) Transcript_970:879-1907(+)
MLRQTPIFICSEGDSEIEIVHDTLQINPRLLHTCWAQCLLRFFCSSQKFQHDLLILHGLTAELSLILLLEFGRNPLRDYPVKLPSTQTDIILRGLHRQLPRLKVNDRHRIRRRPHINEHDMRGLLLRKLLPNILENSIRQSRRRCLIHQPLNTFHPGHLAARQEGPALGIRIIPRNGHHPIPGETLTRIAIALARGLLRRHHAHMLDHHTCHGFDGDDLGFARQGYLNADTIGAPSRVGDGDAFVGEAEYFRLGAGVVEGEADKAFDVGDSVFVVGERGGGGGFSHEAALVETYHVGIETLGISIENHIHTTSPCSRDDAVDGAEINSHDRHCERLLYCFNY